jgi:dTDP-4-dehydrorhamnose reductase
LKVLLTGASGQVGRALIDSVPSGVQLSAFTRAQLDITDPAAVHAAVAAERPDLLINAAAYTAVDRAESEQAQAMAANAAAPRHLAEAADRIPGCRLLHLSTDYVFDGSASRPYRPDDPPNPLSVYGRSKLAGEQAVRELLGTRALVLRTAWVYAPSGRNFLLTMLQLMRERGSVRVVDDQRGTPTAAASIAAALWRAAERREVSGILHWTEGGETTWCAFARAIGEIATEAGLLPALPEVIAIRTEEYPTAARRPRNSVLDCAETVNRLGLAQLPWSTRVRSTILEHLGGLSA